MHGGRLEYMHGGRLLRRGNIIRAAAGNHNFKYVMVGGMPKISTVKEKMTMI